MYFISKNMEQYKGYTLNEIDPINRIVTFTNGKVIRVGEVVGDISEADLRRVQIRETIRSHFEKEKTLFDKGIKVLSLFFIDEVAKYRKYDEHGNELNSEYGEVFEQEYLDLLNEYQELCSNSPYGRYLSEINVTNTHAGYFSIDKKGRKIDSSVKRGSDESDDISAYDLILKDKEKLLSLSNPVRFIFSHSALREGWDNPNVFQICTLKHGGSSATQKRQEVGRGLRLCVNQKGDRMDADLLGNQVHEINQLTVIASDGYKEFVTDLQKGISEDLYERPTEASIEFFTNKIVMVDDQKIAINSKQAKDIYRYLAMNHYIDNNDHISDIYRSALANGTLAPVPESCTVMSKEVHQLIQGIYDERILKSMIKEGRETKISENKLNDNFYKKEFKELWDYINHKYVYTVDFKSDELIKKAIEYIDEKMFVAKLQYKVTSGEQGKDWTIDNVQRGVAFTTQSDKTFVLERCCGSSVKYDLIGKIATGTTLTRKTVAKILKGIRKETFDMFKNNPEEFISKAIKLIEEQKSTTIVNCISYNQTDGVYDSSIFTANKNLDYTKAFEAKKCVQDYVVTDGYATDGKSVERTFVEKLDIADEVCVYAKLPKSFQIPTPVGNYAPDWAIAFNEGTVKYIFFVAETKGSMSSLELNSIEKSKIQCAEKLFNSLSNGNVRYGQIKSYQDLLNIMNK